jgi:hypothetical protein
MCGEPNRLSLYSKLNGTVPVLPKPEIQRSGLPGNYSFVGYLTDVNETRRTFPWQIMLEAENSVEKCLSQCAKFGYPAGGLEYGNECYCGDVEDVAYTGNIRE